MQGRCRRDTGELHRLQVEHAALREAEGAAREQLQLRDSLVRVLGEEARQQAAASTASPSPSP